MTRRSTKKAPAAQAAQPISSTLESDGSVAFVSFSKPLKRGESEVWGTHIRRPGAPELRGLQMMSLIQMDVVQLETLLPRITMPALHKGDFAPNVMDVADLFAMGAEVANFLLTPQSSKGSPPA